MVSEIVMPALSPTMEDGTLARWLVKVGDRIAPGDVIAEIETDKATMELEAADSGVIASISTVEGTEAVRVGTIIATFAKSAEQSDDHDVAAPSQAADHRANRRMAEAEVPIGRTDERNEGRFASRLAQLIANHNGIDLESIVGSGPEGQIIKPDLDRLIEPRKQSQFVEKARLPAVALRSAPGSDALYELVPKELEPLGSTLEATVRRMMAAQQTIPHLRLTSDVELDALIALRSRLNANLGNDGVRITLSDMLIKAYARALLRVPGCNSGLANDTIVRYQRADISVAVSTPDGWVAPVIRNAGEVCLSAISTAMKQLAERARRGQLDAEHAQVGTATFSNLGMRGIRQFDPIINPPQTTSLAIGAARKQSAGENGAFMEKQVMSVTGAFDYRVVDSADAAALLHEFKLIVESPMGLLT